jgi:N-acetylglucosaminyl-diphospho-decaprenol L-rhamnosyltransferase
VNVVVGIVYHKRAAPVPRALAQGVEVVTHVNAVGANGGSKWAGFGANHNHLMESVSGADWYVALNPDVTTTGRTILDLVERAEEGGYTVAAPLLETPWGRSGMPQEDFPGPGRWLKETVRGAGSDSYANGASGKSGMQPSAWVSGACMAIRVGSCPVRFDERYFMYFEDVDLCLRASALGGTVGVCTSIVMEHDSGWSASDPLRSHRGVEFARSALLFAARDGASGTAMRAAGLARYGSRACLRGRAEAERVASRSITRGFLGARTRPGLSDLAEKHNGTSG